MPIELHIQYITRIPRPRLRPSLLRLLLSIPVWALLSVQAFATGNREAGEIADWTPITPLSEETYWSTIDDYKRETVEERFGEPAVVRPFEGIGHYGETLHIAQQSSRFRSFVYAETLLGRGRPDVDRAVIPNIAKSWEYNADGTALTFHLRSGHKWSTGDPFTASDLEFWFDDLFANEEYTTAAESLNLTDLEDVVPIGDTAVRFDFAAPSPGILYLLSDFLIPFAPMEYLKDFHDTHNVNADALAKAAGYDSWTEHLRERARTQGPRLSAWIPDGAEVDPMRLVRNPYYSKIDTDGNQLPYIDRVHIRISDAETAISLALTGELDYGRVAYSDFPLLFSRSQTNDQRVRPELLNASDRGRRETALFFNHTVNDEALRSVFTDSRFKSALSVAINRTEIRDLLFFGIDNLPNESPGSWCMGTANNRSISEFDPDKARNLLDDMGLAIDADGNRLHGDGTPLRLTLTANASIPYHVHLAERVAGYWNRIGVSTVTVPTDNAAFMAQYGSNRLVISIAELNECDYGRILTGRQWWSDGRLWGREWEQWQETDGAKGEEPPPEVQDYFDVWNDVQREVDDQRRQQMVQSALELAAQNLWYVPIVESPSEVVYAHNDLRNIDLAGAPPMRYEFSAAFQWYLRNL